MSASLPQGFVSFTDFAAANPDVNRRSSRMIAAPIFEATPVDFYPTIGLTLPVVETLQTTETSEDVPLPSREFE